MERIRAIPGLCWSASFTRTQGIFPLTLTLSPEYRGEGNVVLE